MLSLTAESIPLPEVRKASVSVIQFRQGSECVCDTIETMKRVYQWHNWDKEASVSVIQLRQESKCISDTIETMKRVCLWYNWYKEASILVIQLRQGSECISDTIETKKRVCLWYNWDKKASVSVIQLRQESECVCDTIETRKREPMMEFARVQVSNIFYSYKLQEKFSTICVCNSLFSINWQTLKIILIKRVGWLNILFYF